MISRLRATRLISKTSRPRARARGPRQRCIGTCARRRRAAGTSVRAGSRMARTLSTIRTTEILPVDLNSLLYKLEITIARGCKAAQRRDCNKKMQAHARARQKAMLQLMWDDEARRVRRLRLAKQHATQAPDRRDRLSVVRRSGRRSAGGTRRRHDARDAADAAWPGDDHRRHRAAMGCAEWLGAAAVDCHRRSAKTWRAGAGGEDRGNAGSPKTRACTARPASWSRSTTCAMREKGAGGEYPVQDGFGWTNAVLIKLLELYPKLARPRYEFTGSGC